MKRVALAALLGLAGCSQENPDVSLLAPSSDGFSAVSSVLELRCGTLDCHGEPARNLRVYGVYGLRADGADVTGGIATTVAEIEATYSSLIGIEPEVLSRVTAERGRTAERWIVVSKAREIEAHTGGQRLVPGSAADRCLLSWLAGEVDVETCAEDRFEPEPLPGESW